MARYTSGMTNPVSIVIRSEGTKGAFVFGGPKKYVVYTGGVGVPRDEAPEDRCAEYSGSLDVLEKRFGEMRQDNALSREDHALLIEALRRARENKK